MHMSTKLDEIRQRHANGYKGLNAERAFPDVAWLLAHNDRLRAGLKEVLRHLPFDSPEHRIVANALSYPESLL